MRYFDVDIKIKEEDKEWGIEIGDNITTPAWSLRPYLLTPEDMERIKYITDQFPVKPEYAAILMTPANTICKTHIDSIARDAWNDGLVPQQWKDTLLFIRWDIANVECGKWCTPVCPQRTHRSDKWNQHPRKWEHTLLFGRWDNTDMECGECFTNPYPH